MTTNKKVVFSAAGATMFILMVVFGAFFVATVLWSTPALGEDGSGEAKPRGIGFYNDIVNKDDILENDYNYGIDVQRLATEAGCQTDEEYNAYFVDAVRWIGDPVVPADMTIPAEFPFADPLWTAQQAFHQDYINRDNSDWKLLLKPGELPDAARDRFLADPFEGGAWDTVANQLYQIEADAVGFETYELTTYTSQGFTQPRADGNLPSAIQMNTVQTGGHAWKRTYASGAVAESRPECMFQWILPPGTDIPGVPVIPPPPYLEEKDPSQDPAPQGNAPEGIGPNDDSDSLYEFRPANPPTERVNPGPPSPTVGGGSKSPESSTHTGSEDPSGNNTRPGGGPAGSGSSDTSNSSGYDTPSGNEGGGTVTGGEII